MARISAESREERGQRGGPGGQETKHSFGGGLRGGACGRRGGGRANKEHGG